MAEDARQRTDDVTRKDGSRSGEAHVGCRGQRWVCQGDAPSKQAGFPLPLTSTDRARPACLSTPSSLIYRWIGSFHKTSSGGSTGAISRLTTTGSWPDRTNTHSSASSRLALIS